MKKQLLIIAQTLMNLLLWLPSLLVVNSCKGLASQNLPIKEGKQEILNTSEPSEVILFCGNPGAGKSSLFNSIFQKNVFKSGVSIGIGMTQIKQAYIHENRKYIDTPGLSDPYLRKQAAEEIEKALKENNNYKIVFVATLEAGRIKPDDLVTINKVCEAIQVNFEYGIVFNKVTKPVLEAIKEEGGLEGYLAELSRKPSSILIIEKVLDMEDTDNVYLPSSSEQLANLESFISNLKAYKIPDNKVQAIDVTNYKEKVREMEMLLSKKKEELNKMNEEISEMEEEINKNANASALDVNTSVSGEDSTPSQLVTARLLEFKNYCGSAISKLPPVDSVFSKENITAEKLTTSSLAVTGATLGACGVAILGLSTISIGVGFGLGALGGEVYNQLKNYANNRMVLENSPNDKVDDLPETQKK